MHRQRSYMSAVASLVLFQFLATLAQNTVAGSTPNCTKRIIEVTPGMVIEAGGLRIQGHSGLHSDIVRLYRTINHKRDKLN